MLPISTTHDNPHQFLMFLTWVGCNGSDIQVWEPHLLCYHTMPRFSLRKQNLKALDELIMTLTTLSIYDQVTTPFISRSFFPNFLTLLTLISLSLDEEHDDDSSNQEVLLMVSMILVLVISINQRKHEIRRKRKFQDDEMMIRILLATRQKVKVERSRTDTIATWAIWTPRH